MAKRVGGAGWQLPGDGCCGPGGHGRASGAGPASACAQVRSLCVVLVPDVAVLDPFGNQMLQQRVQPRGLL